MDVQHTALTGNHAGETDIGEKVQHFIRPREGGAMVAERDLDTEALRHEEQILRDALTHRCAGEAVVARIHPGAYALDRKGPDFGEQVFNRAGNEIRSADADDRSRTYLHEFGKHDFRRTARKTAFTAAAIHVNMLIKKSRGQNLSLGINGFKIGERDGEIAADRENFPGCHQNIGDAQILRRVNAGIADKKSHVLSLLKIREPIRTGFCGWNSKRIQKIERKRTGSDGRKGSFRAVAQVGEELN